MIKTIEQFAPLYDESHEDYMTRYLVWHGGRGGRKSWEIARGLILRSLKSPLLILCTREIQLSISDSVHRLLSNQIKMLGLSNRFEIQKNRIVADTGSEFIFKGLNSLTVDSLKSLEGVDICWVEEAHSVSSSSWEILIPTIRQKNSQIFVSFNPDLASDPVYKMFILNKHPSSYVAYVNYKMNKDCPQTLIDEANYMLQTDPESYAHIWLGEVWTSSDAQIFKGKYRVEAFEVEGIPLQGIDWGFSIDPTVMIRCFVDDNKLYIRNEAYKLHCEIEDMPELFSRIEDSSYYTSRADNSRPELISNLSTKFNIKPCKKWKGCVEDGVQIMRSFQEIIIHPDCPHTIDEFRLYQYKKDKRTGEVLRDIEDKNNHCIDAIRYALEPYINPNFIRVPKRMSKLAKV